jgi:hypothetical protein
MEPKESPLCPQVATTGPYPGDSLQMKERIFWDCKLYDDQRATMMDILSENSKKEYPKSATELLRLEEKELYKASFTS